MLNPLVTIVMFVLIHVDLEMLWEPTSTEDIALLNKKKWKPTYLFERIESSHVESPGYYCDVCTNSCRPRNALRAHKHRGHSFIK